MRPKIALTVGDPAGIGPEICAKAAIDPRVLEVCDPVIYTPTGTATFAPGVLSAEAGRASYDVLLRAVADAQAGVVDAVATAPVNKEAFKLAGIPWAGHTDLLAHLTGADRDDFIAGLSKDNEPTAYVFRCLHCAKLHAYADEA